MTTPWQVQWHIAADGTVIQQRSKGDKPHEQLYGRYSTTRRPELAHLYTLHEDVRRDGAFFDRLTKVLLYAVYLAIAAFVVGLALLWLSAAPEASTPLLVASVPVLVIGAIGAGVIGGIMRRRFERRYLDAGFESPQRITIAATEARAMIEAPGAVSGRKVNVEKC